MLDLLEDPGRVEEPVGDVCVGIALLLTFAAANGRVQAIPQHTWCHEPNFTAGWMPVAEVR